LKDGGSVDIDAETGDPIEEKQPEAASGVSMTDPASEQGLPGTGDNTGQSDGAH
jgi:hypothetical protein